MALGIVWTAMAAVSFLYSIFAGTAGEVSAALLEGAQEAVTTAVAMTGPICLWSGLCAVMDAGGISSAISKITSPFLKRLFPHAVNDSEALTAISGCVTANFLGLGNAATPLGIKAVKRMAQLEKDKSRPNDSMCRFIVLCSASIQLIPSTVAAVRSSLGCTAPFDILPCVWITSVAAAAVGIAMSFILAKVL